MRLVATVFGTGPSIDSRPLNFGTTRSGPSAQLKTRVAFAFADIERPVSPWWRERSGLSLSWPNSVLTMIPASIRFPTIYTATLRRLAYPTALVEGQFWSCQSPPLALGTKTCPSVVVATSEFCHTLIHAGGCAGPIRWKACVGSFISTRGKSMQSSRGCRSLAKHVSGNTLVSAQWSVSSIPCCKISGLRRFRVCFSKNCSRLLRSPELLLHLSTSKPYPVAGPSGLPAPSFPLEAADGLGRLRSAGCHGHLGLVQPIRRLDWRVGHHLRTTGRVVSDSGRDSHPANLHLAGVDFLPRA